MSNKTKGIEGESLAREFLVKKGWEILDINWRGERCEIDIIARDKDTIVFVEVKARTHAAYGWPEEAVTPAKQRNITDAAELYLEEKNLDTEIRFDIISVLDNNGNPQVYHIRDAFAPGEE